MAFAEFHSDTMPCPYSNTQKGGPKQHGVSVWIQGHIQLPDRQNAGLWISRLDKFKSVRGDSSFGVWLPAHPSTPGKV